MTTITERIQEILAEAGCLEAELDNLSYYYKRGYKTLEQIDGKDLPSNVIPFDKGIRRQQHVKTN